MDGDEDDWDFDLLDQLEQNHKAQKGPGPPNHAQPRAEAALPRAVLSNATNLASSGRPDRPAPSQATVKQLWHRQPEKTSEQAPAVSYQVGSSTFLIGSSSGWDDAPSAQDDSWKALTNGYMADAGCKLHRQPSCPPQSSGAGQSGIQPVPRRLEQLEEYIADTMEEDWAGAMEPVLMTCGTTTEGIKVDSDKARHWVYPSHVPRREYQVAMVQTALFHNTLCCLPTGLGKTMIAAVVMYNFYRWFPQGKIVFVAPTKPLVNQQISACAEKTGLPDLVTQELTGSIKADERARLWEEKRVFYCTPATLNNDVAKGICPMKKVVCLVIDECHRATGQHPIVQAVRKLRDAGVKFRLLGLSATPGSRFQAVQEVLANLMISRIEFRSEEDPDVASYTFKKKVEVKVVSSGPNSELAYCRSVLIDTLRSVLRRLVGYKVYFNCSVETATRYSLIQAQQKIKADPSRITGPRNDIFLCFTQAIFLASNFEQLDKYGLAQAHEHADRELAKPALQKLLGCHLGFKEYQQRLASMVSQGSQHPKIQMLQDVVCGHFQSEAGPTGSAPGRVIIFTNLRDSVQGIVTALARLGDLVSAKAFVGQGGGGSGGVGMKQSEQKKVLQMFREGGFNTLVATCIGEEGLDIPAVDLIICFDGAASPTRNIQRMGRTGRHKEGRVVYILAEGKEEQDYSRNQETTRVLHKQLRGGGGQFDLYNRSPRMMPRMFNPEMLMVDLKPEAKPSTAGTAAEAKGGRGKGRGSRGKGRGLANSAARGRGGGGGRRGKGRTGAAPVQQEDDCSSSSGSDSGAPLRVRARDTAAASKPAARPRARQPMQPELIDSSPEADRPLSTRLHALSCSPAPDDCVPPSDDDDFDGSLCLTIRQRTNMLSQRPPSPGRLDEKAPDTLKCPPLFQPEYSTRPVAAANDAADEAHGGVDRPGGHSPGPLAKSGNSPGPGSLHPLALDDDCVLVSPTPVEEALLHLDHPAAALMDLKDDTPPDGAASPGSTVRRLLFGRHPTSHSCLDSVPLSKPLTSESLHPGAVGLDARSLPELVQGAEVLQAAAALPGCSQSALLLSSSAPLPLPGNGLLRRLGALYGSAGGTWALGCAAIQPASAPAVPRGSGAPEPSKPVDALAETAAKPATTAGTPTLTEQNSSDMTTNEPAAAHEPPAGAPVEQAARPLDGCNEPTSSNGAAEGLAEPCSMPKGAVAQLPASSCPAQSQQQPQQSRGLDTFAAPAPSSPREPTGETGASGGDCEGDDQMRATNHELLLTQDTIPLAQRVPRRPHLQGHSMSHPTGKGNPPRDVKLQGASRSVQEEHEELEAVTPSQLPLGAREMKRTPPAVAPAGNQCTRTHPILALSNQREAEQPPISSPEADLPLRLRRRNDKGAEDAGVRPTLNGNPSGGTDKSVRRQPVWSSPGSSPEADLPLRRRKQLAQRGEGPRMRPTADINVSAVGPVERFATPTRHGRTPVLCSPSSSPDIDVPLGARSHPVLAANAHPPTKLPPSGSTVEKGVMPEEQMVHNSRRASPEAPRQATHRQAQTSGPTPPYSDARLTARRPFGNGLQPSPPVTPMTTGQAGREGDEGDELDQVPLASRVPPSLLDTPLSARWGRQRPNAEISPSCTVPDAAGNNTRLVGGSLASLPCTALDPLDSAPLASRVRSNLDVPLSARRRFCRVVSAHGKSGPDKSCSPSPGHLSLPGRPPSATSPQHEAGLTTDLTVVRPAGAEPASLLRCRPAAEAPLGFEPAAPDSSWRPLPSTREASGRDSSQSATPQLTGSASGLPGSVGDYSKDCGTSGRIAIPSVSGLPHSSGGLPSPTAKAPDNTRPHAAAGLSSQQARGLPEWDVAETGSLGDTSDNTEAVEDSQEPERDDCCGATASSTPAWSNGATPNAEKFSGTPRGQRPVPARQAETPGSPCARDDVPTGPIQDAAADPRGIGPVYPSRDVDIGAAAASGDPWLANLGRNVRPNVTAETTGTVSTAAPAAPVETAMTRSVQSDGLPDPAEGSAPSQGRSSGVSREPPELSMSQDGLWDFGQDYDNDDDSGDEDLPDDPSQPATKAQQVHAGPRHVVPGECASQGIAEPEHPLPILTTPASVPRPAGSADGRDHPAETADDSLRPERETGGRDAPPLSRLPAPLSPVLWSSSPSKVASRTPRVEYDPDGFARPTPRRRQRPACLAASTPGQNLDTSCNSGLLADGSPGNKKRGRCRAVLIDSSPEDDTSQRCLPPAVHATPLQLSTGPSDDPISGRAVRRPKVLFDSPNSAPRPPAHRRRKIVSGLEDSPMEAPPGALCESSQHQQRAINREGGQGRDRSPAVAVRRGHIRRRNVVEDSMDSQAAEKRQRVAERTAAKLSRRRAAKMFFDEEAEDSDEADGGGSDDPEDDRDLEGFIVATQDIAEPESSAGPHATPASSADGGDINMYRRMLLQSATPVGGRGGWHHRMMRYMDHGPGLGMASATPSTGGPSTGCSTGASHHDTCDRCGLDGELLLCDTCPRAFHLNCVGIREVPDGEWSCQHCTERSCDGPSDRGPGERGVAKSALFAELSEGEEGEEEDDLPNFDL